MDIPKQIRRLQQISSKGYAAHSPGCYSLVACLVPEVVLTFMFLTIILGATVFTDRVL
jgi:glycerol uptake facilitator-like aquaporin